MEYKSKSGQLKLELVPAKRLVKGTYLNLGDVTPDEYMEYMKMVGDVMEREKIGKIFLDMSNMSRFGINLRAVAINNVGPLVVKRAPYFLVSILKPKNVFESLATEAALKAAKPLSKKFVDGKMFGSTEEAIQWLEAYNVPEEYLK